jgi:hypothetical protein
VKKFLNLAVDPVDSGSRLLIEKELNRAADWLRYLPNSWLIYTSQPAKIWYERLSKIPGMKDGVLFICEVNLENRAGWLKKTAWDWISKARE